jgi:hypothetical protein
VCIFVFISVCVRVSLCKCMCECFYLKCGFLDPLCGFQGPKPPPSLEQLWWNCGGDGGVGDDDGGVDDNFGK